MPRPETDGFTLRRAAAAACLALALAACGGDGPEGGEGNAGASGADTGAAAAGAAPPAPQPSAGADTLSDVQIFAVLSASDQSEIQPSRIAEEKAQDPRLKEYARRMVTDHTTMSDSMRALAQRIGATPADHPLSQAILTETQAVTQRLQGLSGMDFDTAYAAAMAQSHQQALSTVEQRLVQRAQNAELRTALEQKVRPAVAMHLEQIRQIQQSLGSGAAGGAGAAPGGETKQ